MTKSKQKHCKECGELKDKCPECGALNCYRCTPDACPACNHDRDISTKRFKTGQKHTPTPWRISKGVYEILGQYQEPYKSVTRLIANFKTTTKTSQYEEVLIDNANASFIVRACNSHEELLAALKQLKKVSLWSELASAVGGMETTEIALFNKTIADAEKAIINAESNT